MSFTTNDPDEAAPPRRWSRVPQACDHSGMSKSSLYKIASQNPGLFRKHGRSTFVDLQMLDKIIEDAPPAELATPPPATS
jgi:hypothetical protein